MDSEDIAPQSQRDEPSEADTISGNQAGGYKATLKSELFRVLSKSLILTGPIRPQRV